MLDSLLAPIPGTIISQSLEENDLFGGLIIGATGGYCNNYAGPVGVGLPRYVVQHTRCRSDFTALCCRLKIVAGWCTHFSIE